jgi:hypothetical protein
MAYGDYVNSTMQQFGGDLGRATKFSFLITIPFTTTGSPEQFDILCKNVNIPNVRNDSIEFKYKGHDIKIPGRTNYDQTLSATFYLDEFHDIRSSIDEWIRVLDGDVISGEAPFSERSKNYGTIQVRAQNFDESADNKMYTFYNVYPISVGGPEYNTEGVSSVQEITLEFAFSYFIVEDGTFNPSRIFEDFKNKVVDMGVDKLKNLFGGDEKTYRSGIPAAIDFFRKTKR